MSLTPARARRARKIAKWILSERAFLQNSKDPIGVATRTAELSKSLPIPYEEWLFRVYGKLKSYNAKQI